MPTDKQTTAEQDHLIIGAHITRRYTGMQMIHTLRNNRVQRPTDLNPCIEMTHTEEEE